MINVGDYRTRLKLTGAFYFALEATPTAYANYGNQELVKMDPKLNQSKRTQSAKGYVQVIHEEPGEVEWRYSMKMTEFVDNLLGLMHQAAAPSAVNQSSNGSATATLSAVALGAS